MYVVRLWTDKGEIYFWRVKDHDLGKMKNEQGDVRSFSATLEDGRQIIIYPASIHTVVIEEIPYGK